MDTFDALQEAEARLLAVISYCEACREDVVEFEKALRLIELRRGLLLGPRRPGVPRVEEVEASPPTMARWRALADHATTVLEALAAATDARAVSQAAMLRLIDHPDGNGQAEWCSVRLDDLDACAATLRRRLTPAECGKLAGLLVTGFAAED
jgi:hypothetical protein